MSWSFLQPQKRYLRDLPEMPKCASTHVFLWEALNLCGQALLGEDWTGDELNAISWPTSPITEREAQKRKPTSAPPPPPINRRVNPDANQSLPPWMLENPQQQQHVLDWKLHSLFEHHQARWEANQAAIRRMQQAVDWLHKKFRDGEIATFSRFETGGLDLLPLEPSDWFVENVLDNRFRQGGYKRIFLSKPATAHDVFIFVNKASLEREISTLPHTSLSISGTDISNLSPYLRFAVAFALRHGRELDGWGKPSVAKQCSSSEHSAQLAA